jgi:hypothetical protein
VPPQICISWAEHILTFMDSNPRPLPPELREALDANGGMPLRFVDPDTHEEYVLEPVRATVALDEESLDAAIEQGMADIEAGRIVPWDPERIKAEGRRLLGLRKARE